MSSPASPSRRLAHARLLLALSILPSAFAADGTWTGSGPALWDVSDTNWSGVAGTPWDETNGATNRAVFSSAGATPSVSGSVYSNGLGFTQTATISGGTIFLAGVSPTVDAPANATISSVLSGNAGLEKTGSGTVILSGLNDYSGGTTISAGVISVGSLTSTGPGSLGNGTLTINGGTLRYTGPANNTSPGWTRSYTIGANGATFDLSSATGQLWIGGTAGFTGSGPRTVTVTTGATGGGRFGSNLGDGTGGATSFVKNGAGTLIMSGSNNTYSGQLQILQGSVQYGNVGLGGESSGAGHSVAISSGASLIFRHANTDVVSYGAPISGAGSVTMNSGNSTAGLLTLSGANSYSGGTTLTFGTLALGAPSVGSVGAITSSAIGTGNLVFNSGGLSSNGTVARTILNPVSFSTNGNATLGSAVNTGKLNFSANVALGTSVRILTAASDAQFDGIVSGGTGGGITKTGAGTLTLSNNNTYTGITTISGGVLSTGVLANGGAASGIGAASNTAANLVIDGGTLRYSGPAVATWNRAFTIGTNNATFDLSAATGQLNIAGAIAYSGSGPRSLTIQTGASGGRVGSILADGTGGATSLVKTGAGTLVISGANTYAGQLQVQAGTAQLGNAGAGGESSGVGHSVAVSSGATLAFRHASTDSVTFNAPISGDGGVNFNYNNSGVGGGSLTLGGNNSFTGGLIVNPTSGNTTLSVKAGSTTALGSGNVNIGQYGRLDLNGFSNTVGLLTSNNATAAVTNNGASDATLTLNAASGSQTFGGTIFDGTTNKVSLTKAGGGTQTLSGLNTYTGATIVSGGNLTISATGGIANTSFLSVSPGATFINSGAALSVPLSVGEGATLGGLSSITATALTFAADLGNGLSRVSVGAGVSAGGTLTFSLTNVTAGDFSLFSNSISSTFTNVLVGATPLVGSGLFTGEAGGWIFTFNDALDQLSVAAIPEPGTYAAFAGSALLAYALTKRRRRSL